MASRLCILSIVIAGVAAQQPPGVSDPVYNCTFKEGALVSLSVSVQGVPVACGNTSAFNAHKIDETPSVSLHGARPDGLYALLLLNPDDIIPKAFVNPIMHNAVFNIKGSDLAAGRIDHGDALVPFFRPNPPLPYWTFHYVYLAFEQKEMINITGLPQGHTKFPLADVMAQQHLTLVGTNYFTAKWKLFSRGTDIIV